MSRNRLVRVVGGTTTLILGVAVAGWASSTLWTYHRYVADLGSFTSRFAWRSLSFGMLEIAIALGLLWFAFRLFGSPEPD